MPYYMTEKVFIHLCEAYLAGTLYLTDFSYILTGEENNKPVRDTLRKYYEEWSKKSKEEPTSYEDASKDLAKKLHAVQVKELKKKLTKVSEKIDNGQRW